MNPLKSTLHPWIIRMLCAFAFVLPASSKLASIVLAILFALCLAYKISDKKFFRFSSPLMLWIMLFYVLHAVGLLYTENFSYAGLDLQIKASFLLMPLFIDNISFSNIDFRKIARAFAAGCTLYVLVLLLNACLEYSIWHDISSFFYIDFSAQQHVAYLTLYINCALFFLVDEYLRVPGYNLRNRYFLIFWMVFLVFIVSLLSSRTALAATFITLPLYIYFRSRAFTGKGSVLFATGAVVLIAMIYVVTTGSRNRFEEAATVSATTEVTAPSSSTVQHNVRFTVWKNVMEVYSHHPLFGVGTGDIKDELMKQYRKTGFSEGELFNLSPHNQFLHTLLLLGIPGLVVLVLIFYSGIRIAGKERDWLPVFLIVATIINCMTEGMLEKQGGVLFFVFFLVIFQGNEKITWR